MLTILCKWIAWLLAWLQSFFRLEPITGEQIMSSLSIQPTYPIFTDIDGQPLEDGFIWIGEADLDPQTNPIDVYWDAALTIPAAQPIRTLAGYPSNSGTPGRFYANQDYSIRVMNKNGGTLYTSLNGNEFYGNMYINGTGNGATTVFSVPFVPRLIFIDGVYQNQSTYTIAGGNVTFSEAPPHNSVIEFLL